MGSGPHTDKHPPQSLFTGKFILLTTFCIAFYESYLSTMLPHDAQGMRSFSQTNSTGMTKVQFYPFLTPIIVENICLGFLSFSGIYLVPGGSASQTLSSGTGIKRFISSFCLRTVKVDKGTVKKVLLN